MNSISFVQDDEIKTIDFDSNEFKPTTTVLNYLRSSARHKGTKEGCAEGDCGACTVVLGELNEQQQQIIYTAVDSCLVFLPMIHGKQLITIENIVQQVNDEILLHPVQQEVVDRNGSQCGFCTPGFVMSLFALYKKDTVPSKSSVEDALTGNLCRCTGYKPIVEAATSACIHQGRDQFTKNEKEIRPLLLQLREKETAVRIQTRNQKYFQPKTLTEALQLKAEFPESLLINGSTDVALRVTKKHELLSMLIDLSFIKEIKHFEKNKNEIVIGAGMSLEEIKSHVEKELPALFNILKVFGSRQIRSLATLGGNIGSASPIGDTIPVLMAYDAIIRLQSINGKREININDFITGYRQTKKNTDELITAVSIPVPYFGCLIKSYKVSKRKDLDIASVNACFRLKLNGEIVDEVLLAFGGMAATTKRATTVERFLIGKSWNRKIVEEAAQLLDEEFAPITDARSGAEFRRVVARNLLLKFWSEK